MGVVILSDVAGPEVENAVVGVAEPVVVAVSVFGVAASGVVEPVAVAVSVFGVVVV